MLRFCYYIKAVFTVNIFSGGASKWQNANSAKRAYPLAFRFLTLTDVPTAHLEAQCEARQGRRKRHSQARLRLHSLHAQRQGHPRIIIA